MEYKWAEWNHGFGSKISFTCCQNSFNLFTKLPTCKLVNGKYIQNKKKKKITFCLFCMWKLDIFIGQLNIVFSPGWMNAFIYSDLMNQKWEQDSRDLRLEDYYKDLLKNYHYWKGSLAILEQCCLERNFRVNWDLQMIQNKVKLT